MFLRCYEHKVFLTLRQPTTAESILSGDRRRHPRPLGHVAGKWGGDERMSKKLSLAQQRIVDRIKDGWELGMNGGMDPRFWIQKDGLCRGGASEKVSLATVHALEDRGIIKRCKPSDKDPYWLTRFALVPPVPMAEKEGE
jgi:hypothetical protein